MRRAGSGIRNPGAATADRSSTKETQRACCHRGRARKSSRYGLQRLCTNQACFLPIRSPVRALIDRANGLSVAVNHCGDTTSKSRVSGSGLLPSPTLCGHEGQRLAETEPPPQSLADLTGSDLFKPHARRHQLLGRHNHHLFRRMSDTEYAAATSAARLVATPPPKNRLRLPPGCRLLPIQPRGFPSLFSPFPLGHSARRKAASCWVRCDRN